MRILLTILYVIFTTGGLTFMKLGGDSLHLALKGGFNLKIGWVTFLGFCLYLISFFLWQRMLVKYDLSTMVPIVTGIVQIIILLIGYLVFKESLSIVSLIGVLLVIGGIILIVVGK